MIKGYVSNLRWDRVWAGKESFFWEKCGCGFVCVVCLGLGVSGVGGGGLKVCMFVFVCGWVFACVCVSLSDIVCVHLSVGV